MGSGWRNRDLNQHRLVINKWYILNSPFDTVSVQNFHLSVMKMNMTCFLKLCMTWRVRNYCTDSWCLKWVKGLTKDEYLWWLYKFREGTAELDWGMGRKPPVAAKKNIIQADVLSGYLGNPMWNGGILVRTRKLYRCHPYPILRLHQCFGKASVSFRGEFIFNDTLDFHSHVCWTQPMHKHRSTDGQEKPGVREGNIARFLEQVIHWLLSQFQTEITLRKSKQWNLWNRKIILLRCALRGHFWAQPARTNRNFLDRWQCKDLEGLLCKACLWSQLPVAGRWKTEGRPHPGWMPDQLPCEFLGLAYGA